MEWQTETVTTLFRPRTKKHGWNWAVQKHKHKLFRRDCEDCTVPAVIINGEMRTAFPECWCRIGKLKDGEMLNGKEENNTE